MGDGLQMVGAGTAPAGVAAGSQEALPVLARDMPTDHLDAREGFGGSSIMVCSMILSARRPASVASTLRRHSWRATIHASIHRWL